MVLALFVVIEDALRSSSKAGRAVVNASLELVRAKHPVREAAFAHLRPQEQLVHRLLAELGRRDPDLAAQVAVLLVGAYAVGGSRREDSAPSRANAAAAVLLAGRAGS